MPDRVVLHRGRYHDSAFLMRLASEVRRGPGIEEAVVVMGTPMNVDLLRGAGFRDPVLATATPLDLVVALRSRRTAPLDAAEADIEKRLAPSAAAGPAAIERPATVADALAERPSANLVSIAVPGPYAAYLAHRALDAGRHVFLFSDNVALEDEVVLKRRARQLGLLVMGPDCGTAFLGGAGIGFMNRVRRGRVGLVGASGTGMQEVACLVHAAGEGVSQAIGTGSRDLSAAVDGCMTEAGLERLAADPQTAAIVVVAKHPAPETAARLHPRMASLGKPVVVRYLGQEPPAGRGVTYTATLDAAAAAVVEALPGRRLAAKPSSSAPRVPGDERGSVHGRLVGLFSGGSFAAEAAWILHQAGRATTSPEAVSILAGIDPGGMDRPRSRPRGAGKTRRKPEVGEAGGWGGTGHVIVDTGDDAYTVGRPHPMVDQEVRCALVQRACADPAVGLVLIDLVLGDGAHVDPAPEIAAAVLAGRGARRRRPLRVVASIAGTDLDPQGIERQRRVLREAGVRVESSAARAARVAALLLGSPSAPRRSR